MTDHDDSDEVNYEGDDRHPSYGAVQLTRTSGGDPSLFMSDVPHDYRISLSIKEAKRERSINDDRHYAGPESIIEVEMSEHQFARLVGSVGIGSGVPCTIKRRNGELVERPPSRDKFKVFDDELEEIRDDFEGSLDELEEEAEEILDPDSGGSYLSKGDRQRLLDKIKSSKRSINDHLPHLFRMLREDLEGAVHDAKSEVEAQAARLADYVRVKAEARGLISDEESGGILAGLLGDGPDDDSE